MDSKAVVFPKDSAGFLAPRFPWIIIPGKTRGFQGSFLGRLVRPKGLFREKFLPFPIGFFFQPGVIKEIREKLLGKPRGWKLWGLPAPGWIRKTKKAAGLTRGGKNPGLLKLP